MTEIDLLVYGATGFTGKLTSSYLKQHAPGDLSWGIGGRNRSKLERLAHELGLPLERVLVADAYDDAALSEMAHRTAVIANTAGPFAKYGDGLVAACVDAHTHYVDITGETPWVRRLIDQHHDRAKEDGTRIVPCCGFDSVPSDLGALMMVDHFRDEVGEDTRAVRAFFKGKGGLNGGTLASALSMAESGDLEEAHADPILLNPPSHRSNAERDRNRDRLAPHYEPHLGRWAAPFFMAPFNTRVVRRSAALFDIVGRPYGPGFNYQEYMDLGSRAGSGGWLATQMIAGALKAGGELMKHEVIRKLMARVGPEPGQGPSLDTIESGYSKCHYVAESEGGRVAHGVLEFHGDPGNKLTTLLLAESALALAAQRGDLEIGPGSGGVLTPAVALGRVLMDRIKRAGVRMEVPVEPSA